MTPKQFVDAYLPYARQTEAKTGIPAEIILSQAALESGWGKSAPGNMFFGVKDIDGVNGNEQLLTTFEFSKRANLSEKEIGLVSITKVEPVVINGVKFFKYIGKAYFRKYNTPEESFTHHAQVFLKPRYAKALSVKDDAEQFFIEVQAAGYAQSPTYADTLIAVLKSIRAAMKTNVKTPV